MHRRSPYALNFAVTRHSLSWPGSVPGYGWDRDKPLLRSHRPGLGQSFLHRPSGNRESTATAEGLTAAAADDDPLQRRRRAEAVMLFHRGPITLRKLAQLAGLADATEARTLLRKLNELYDRTGSALRVEQIAGGYQLLTHAGLAPWLRRFVGTPTSLRLSTPALETLAIVAYRQPVLRANIEAIRGVACGELLRQLMQRDLVRICGRSDELGRPFLYGTTKHFLQTFGLKDVHSLPSISGVEVDDDSDNTCGNSIDPDQATTGLTPIEPINQPDVHLSSIPSNASVTEKESDVSTACVRDELCDSLPLPGSASLSDLTSTDVRPSFPLVGPRAVDDDDEDDDYYDDDDDEEDEDDDVEDDDWDDEDDDEVIDADEGDEDVDDEWEEVGDEDDDEEIKDDEDADEEDEEDDDWDDEDDEDEDWDDEDEDDEDEEWD